MAARQPRQHAVQLEYIFDRLLSAKLVQAYQLLVPEKVWVTGEGRDHNSGESTQHENSGDLCTRILGSAEKGTDHQESDGGADRANPAGGVHDTTGVGLRRRRL